jgi:hypothetical protein
MYTLIGFAMANGWQLYFQPVTSTVYYLKLFHPQHEGYSRIIIELDNEQEFTLGRAINGARGHIFIHSGE